MKRILLLLAFGVALSNCSKDETQPLLNIDPSDSEAMANEITFTPSTTKVNGTPPAPSSSGTAPVISSAASASVVASGTVYIPVTYTANTAPSSMLIQVVGANTFYFSIPLSGAGLAGTLTIPMTISSRVLTGNFLMSAYIQSNGELSQPMTIPATVTEPLACGDGFVTGSEGVTNTRHQLGGKAGTVVISYDTYSVPDRVDVFLDGVWKGGTGGSITPPPPIKNCADVVLGDGSGFLGTTGTINVTVTAASKNIDVYVSGCLGSGTAWDYTLTCPN